MTIRRRYVDGPFGQIHLAETEPPPADAPGAIGGLRCLLIHQTPRSWDEFAEVMERLDGRVACTAMDLPGMGASDPGPTPARIEHYADAADAVLAQLTDCTTVAICGHHTGGVVALELAARRGVGSEGGRFPIQQLVLSSTPWVDADARRSRAEGDPIDTITRTADGTHLLALWAGRAPHYPIEPDSGGPDGADPDSTDPGHRGLLDRFMADALRATDPAVGHRAVGAYRMEQRIARVACPVTVIEHGADPFASRHTDDLVQALGPRRVSGVVRLPDGRVPLEATAPAFADALAEALSPAASPSPSPSL